MTIFTRPEGENAPACRPHRSRLRNGCASPRDTLGLKQVYLRRPFRPSVLARPGYDPNLLCSKPLGGCTYSVSCPRFPPAQFPPALSWMGAIASVLTLLSDPNHDHGGQP